MDTRRIRARDTAARRLRRLTAALVAAAGALALIFAVVAAKAFPGRTSHPATAPVRKAARPAAATRTPRRRQTAPPLVSVQSQTQPQAPSPAPAPAPAAPAPTAAPPVVVSGGS